MNSQKAFRFGLAVLFLASGSLLAIAADHDHDHSAADESPAVETKLKIAKTDTTIHVGDMHCKTCAKKIASRLYAVKGVIKVRTDVAADIAVVTPQKKKQLDVKALWAASQKAGFQPTKLVGPGGTFEADPKTKKPREVEEKVEEVALRQPATL